MSNSKRKRKPSVSGRYFPDDAVRYRFDFYRSYRSDIALEADLSRWLDELAAKARRRAQAQREEAARMAETIGGLAPGRILYHAWGYDQTK